MRGRPRKNPVVETVKISSTIEELATLLSAWCGIPGCMGKNHTDEALAIKDLLEKKGIKIY